MAGRISKFPYFIQMSIMAPSFRAIFAYIEGREKMPNPSNLSPISAIFTRITDEVEMLVALGGRDATIEYLESFIYNIREELFPESDDWD